MSTDGGYELYHYNPSFIAAAVAATMFAQTTAYHIWQLSRKKTWYFIPFVIGGICKFSTQQHIFYCTV